LITNTAEINAIIINPIKKPAPKTSNRVLAAGLLTIAIAFALFLAPLATAQSVSTPAQPPSKTPSNTQATEKPHFRFKALASEQLDSIGEQSASAHDHQGFMWFSGSNGLVRYDGYVFKIYKHDSLNPRSLSTNVIHDLLVDRQGRLWVATNLGLNKYNQKTDDFTHYLFSNDTPFTSLSYNAIRCIIQDKNDVFWIGSSGGGIIQFNAETEVFTSLSFTADEKYLNTARIRHLAEDKRGDLWIGTENNGLYRYNPNTETLRHYSTETKGRQALSHNKILSLHPDSNGDIWVGTSGGGLNRFDRKTEEFSYYQQASSTNSNNSNNNSSGLSSNIIWGIQEDQRGNLWIAVDDGGLNLLDRESDTIFSYQHHPGDQNSISNNKARSIYEDRNGGLWIGHYPSGLSKLDRYGSAFISYRHDPANNNSLSHSSVLSVAEDTQSNFWVGTEYGLNYINRKTHKITRYSDIVKTDDLIGNSPILSIAEDDTGDIWIGTWRKGLSRLNRTTQKLTHYSHKTHPSGPKGDDEIWTLLQDKQQRLWIGTQDSGMYLYDHQQDKFTKILIHDKPYTSGRILVFYHDRQGNFWVGSDTALHQYDPEQQSVRHTLYDTLKPEGISNSSIRAISEDHFGNLWIGTWGGGANKLDLKTGKYTTFSSKNGLADNVVTGIIEDKQGFLWFSTSKGLSRFNQKDNSFRNYGKQHGLSSHFFNIPAYLKTKQHELVFGSSNGLIIINPAYIVENQTPPPVVITDFLILNKPVAIGAPNSPLTQAITQTKTLRLDHTESVFSFSFAALNYRLPEKNQYAYKLDGFDKDWNHIGHRRTATYTNLDPGHYVFRVKASNNEGVWNETGRAIDIHILPPWWQTWWAYSLYIVIASALLWLLGYSNWHKKQASNERQVNQRLLQIDSLKDAFLANTSHELRTPLNGIIGLSESLIAGVTGELPEKTISNLQMVVNSGRQLSYLIDDILDFSKLREHKIQLNCQTIYLYRVADTVMSLTQHLVNSKPVILTNNIGTESVYADESRLQQILYNLIGNAIKFTEKGSVTISAETKGQHIWISISDTGIGVPVDKVTKIFEAFEQADDSESRRHGGTGLGLAVSRQLIELHKGTIHLESTLDEGSTFSFSLPITTADTEQLQSNSAQEYHANEQVAIPSPSRSLIPDDTLADTEPVVILNYHSETHNEGRKHILIVDDEAINRQVLVNLLSLKNYRVTQCCNGKQTLQLLAGKNDIDLILLDVMMPDISGFDICKKIRDNYALNELPILFLSATNQIQDMQVGYDVGANDYLSKPIAKEMLFVRIETHLKLLETYQKLEGKIEALQQEIREK